MRLFSQMSRNELIDEISRLEKEVATAEKMGREKVKQTFYDKGEIWPDPIWLIPAQFDQELHMEWKERRRPFRLSILRELWHGESGMDPRNLLQFPSPSSNITTSKI